MSDHCLLGTVLSTGDPGVTPTDPASNEAYLHFWVVKKEKQVNT